MAIIDGWVVKIGVEVGMTEEEMTQNVWNFFYYFDNLGFSVEAISGMLGNIQQESAINSGDKQGESEQLGWGLIQWTPATGLINAMRSIGKEWYDPYGQCYLIYNEAYGGSWIPTTAYPISWEQFQKINNVDEATKAYLYNRERAGIPMLEKRIAYGRHWYEVLTGTPPIPPTPTKKRKMPLYMMLRRL